MSLELGEVVKRVLFIELASVDEAHIKIASVGAFESPVKERIFPVQNGLFEKSLNRVVM